MLFAKVFSIAFYLYLAVGLVFGCWFVLRGVHRVDAKMQSASWILRLMILPGSLLLWPLLLRKVTTKGET